MKTPKYVGALFLSLLINGCATISNGDFQNVTISTPNNSAIEKTRCKVTNEEGEWLAAPEIPLGIHRDGNPMRVKCLNRGQSGTTSVSPEFDGEYVVLDLLLDLCVISCFVDGYNNTFYSYPTTISVPMVNDNQTEQIQK
jgi:hypothetical protein